jgi:hypothetical protein
LYIAAHHVNHCSCEEADKNLFQSLKHAYYCVTYSGLFFFEFS